MRLLPADRHSGKSNAKNIGVVNSSNLCTEIMEVSTPDETAVCNLASLALPSFIRSGVYDFQKLHDVTKVVAFSLSLVIDVNYYPVPEAKRSNMRNRPIGLGVQGLADAFNILRLPFDSEEARKLNVQIFETVYHAAVVTSKEVAITEGPYETYEASPASQDQFQLDLWGVTLSELWDWASLKEKVAKHGLRNSLLVAPMPTAFTSQILGFDECFGPYTRYGPHSIVAQSILISIASTSTLAVSSPASSRSSAPGSCASLLTASCGTTT